jgi:hypothetical protein
MKRDIVRTICFATLFLALPAVALAQGHRDCSNAGLAGAWGYTETGTVISPMTGEACGVKRILVDTILLCSSFARRKDVKTGWTVSGTAP